MKFVLVLLGNKGEAYTHTRHNAARVLFSEVPDVPSGFEILTPSGFMNESGLDVAKYMRYHEHVEPIVIYDDKDVELGTMRLSFDRGDGGHNGLKSVIQCLGRKDFLRLRVGIAPVGTGSDNVKPIHGDAVQGFVMGTMQAHEKEALLNLAQKIPALLICIYDEGFAKAMEKYNAK